MNSKFKKLDINCINQREDNGLRYDYGKTNISFGAAIRGEDDKIKDCR